MLPNQAFETAGVPKLAVRRPPFHVRPLTLPSPTLQEKRNSNFVTYATPQLTELKLKEATALSALAAAGRRKGAEPPGLDRDEVLAHATATIEGLQRGRIRFLQAPNIAAEMPTCLDSLAGAARKNNLQDVLSKANNLGVLIERSDIVIGSVVSFGGGRGWREGLLLRLRAGL